MFKRDYGEHIEGEDGTEKISVEFVQRLLAGEITFPEDIVGKNDFEVDWLVQLRERLEPAFINSHLRFESLEQIRNELAMKLLRIVYCHSYQGGTFPEARANNILEWHGYQKWHSNMAVAYLSGMGLCMHLASMGVAIARANGFQASIAGHPEYIRDRVGHHYGVWLHEEGEKDTLIVPRGWNPLAIFKNRQFQLIPDTPA